MNTTDFISMVVGFIIAGTSSLSFYCSSYQDYQGNVKVEPIQKFGRLMGIILLIAIIMYIWIDSALEWEWLRSVIKGATVFYGILALFVIIRKLG